MTVDHNKMMVPQDNSSSEMEEPEEDPVFYADQQQKPDEIPEDPLTHDDEMPVTVDYNEIMEPPDECQTELQPEEVPLTEVEADTIYVYNSEDENVNKRQESKNST